MPSRKTPQKHPPPPPAGPNWTLIAIIAIVGLVAMVGMVRPDRVVIPVPKEKSGIVIEKYQTTDQK